MDQGIYFCTESSVSRSNYWLMTNELENRQERDQFYDETNNNFVMTRSFWQIPLVVSAFEKCLPDDQRNAKYLQARIVIIPSSGKIRI